MTRLAFVVGTGRTGSTALTRLLHTHHGVLSLNEYWSSFVSPALGDGPLSGAEFFRRLAAPNESLDLMIGGGLDVPEILYHRGPGRRFDSRTTGVPALCQMVLPALTDDPDALFDEVRLAVEQWQPRVPAGHHRALFDWLSARFGGDLVVERSGRSLRLVPDLREAFPDAVFVHMHRNGPDCALSMSRHAAFRSRVIFNRALEAAQMAWPERLTKEHIAALPPELAPLFADPRLIWDHEVDLALFGSMWSQMIIEGEKALREIPEASVMHLGYEELLERPQDTLRRLAEFVGVDADSDWLEEAAASLRADSRGSALRLPAAERDVLVRACEPGAQALAAVGSSHG